MNLKLDNLNALVTGGAGGIGRAISLTLAKAGAHVIIVCRNKEKGEACLKEIETLGGKASLYPFDLSSESARTAGMTQILKDHRSIDILVNNAGISGYMGTVDGTPLNELNTVLEVNLVAPFHLSQLCIPMMQSKGFGRIINISSVAPRVNPANTVTYNMSKAGLNCFTTSLSREVGQFGITVNGIAPGLILTDRILEKRLPGLAAETGMTKEQILEGMESKSDTRALTQEEDLADTVLFLCSNTAKNISGETIELSGGYHA